MKTQEFNTVVQLNNELVNQFIQWINQAIADYGQARILLSGGSTPISFYNLLEKKEMDWTKISIGLVDERYVDQSSDFSNETLIHQTLLQNHLKETKVVPMVQFKDDTEKNLVAINEGYSSFIERTDIVLLGMGDDGHTASLFPNDVASKELLKSNQKGIFYTSAPNHPKDRITCSPAILEAATHCVLLLHGSKKREVLQKSEDQNLPIARFINRPNFQLYYSKS